MSYNKFLNNKVSKSCDTIMSGDLSFLCLHNRDSTDYFFNKSDLDKMAHFENLIERYKLCNKVYYYFSTKSNLWIEERTDDSVINRICEETQNILEPEKKHVLSLLLEARNKLNVEDKNKFDEINESIKDFNKFIDKAIKEHQKVKFARSVLSFFHHKISDADFMDKINIDNHHLLPLKTMNLNLKTMTMEKRDKHQYFTKCLDIYDLEGLDESSEEFQQVDKFFLDICSGHDAKKQYV